MPWEVLVGFPSLTPASPGKGDILGRASLQQYFEDKEACELGEQSEDSIVYGVGLAALGISSVKDAVIEGVNSHPHIKREGTSYCQLINPH